MYIELYPGLKNAFNFENFEEIAETLDKHFNGLFNLPVLEQEAKLGSIEGSYMTFFSLIMSELQGLYTTGEISTQIYDLLQNNPEVRDCFLEKLIFVPPLANFPSSQLAFLEKTATGELKVAEPVTFLDMLRVSWSLQRLHYQAVEHSDVAILNLDTIELTQAETLKAANRALMINFNRDSRGTPKWGVVDLRDESSPQVYCETPLLEAEKKELEQRLNITFREVSPGKSDSLQSTGYTAIAWLDQNITKGWNFDPNADFNVLLGSYIFAQFKGDGGGIHYAAKRNEYHTYFTAGLKAVIDARYGLWSDPEAGSQKWGAFSLIKLAGFTMLGNIDDESVALNDLARVIKIVGEKRVSKMAFDNYFAMACRSNIPRFDFTISTFGYPKVLVEACDSVSLTVPVTIERARLREAHSKACEVTNTNDSLIDYITRKHDSGTWEEDAATAMVLSLLRARAKKKELIIHLPEKFQVCAAEQRFIVNLMQDNPYVCEFTINNNKSLSAIKKELLSVFARNRWLAENGYRPPLVDNYWQRAAKYWLVHLNEQNNVLADKREHDGFKRCVREMGLTGLNSALSLLRDDNQRDVIEGIYGKNKPEFYAACQAVELDEYLDTLIRHLKHKTYFPFSKLGVSWKPGTDSKFIELFEQINQLEQFEEVTLTDCLASSRLLKTFLVKLAVNANQQKWTGLIVIPELEDKHIINNEYRELRSAYINLNNVILHNRHVKAAASLVEKIKSASDFSEPSIDKTHTFITPSISGKASIEIDEAFSAFSDQKSQGPWPIKRGGVVQLQLQQQQEIQQSRQIQQEQQKTQMQVLEEIIVGELVTYDNIDTLLGKYYRDFSDENLVNRSSATLRQGNESILKGFFHTWINARPNVAAKHVIQSMTVDAAKMLLRKHVRFSSGLSLDNLPRGFYTQRTKDGALILGYSPEIGYVNGTNPFTLDLNVATPEAGPWQGDFRQFTIQKYLKAMPTLSHDDFQSLILFAKLQPLADYQSDFNAFCRVNPEIKEKITAIDRAQSGVFSHFMGTTSTDAASKAVKHWLVLLQAWTYEGLAGVDTFFKMTESELTLNLQQAYAILFQNQSPQIKKWVATIQLSERHLRALGQVYYRYGDEVVTLLLAKFRQIDMLLGRDFFERFHEHALSHSENYDCFISERFFGTIDGMIFRLQPHKAMFNRQAWLVISEKHYQTVPWENIETLWKAFDYFLAEIAELGLELKGGEFNEVKAENMLVALDRILETLKRIPAQNEKVNFLRRLPEFQLTHGGVHYAIIHEGFKYFDDALQLHDFADGKPTYGPNLASLYTWRDEESELNIRRTLASRSQFSHDNYRYLSSQLATGDVTAKDTLIWLMYTQYDSRQIESVYDEIVALGDTFKAMIARHLHHAVFGLGNQSVSVNKSALLALDACLSMREERFASLLEKFPHATFLEASSILWQSERWQDFDALLQLLEAPIKKDADYPDYLFREAYKLAALFGINEPQQLNAFYRATSSLKPIVHNQLRLLMNQVMSIDFENSKRENLKDPRNWAGLLACIDSMKRDLAHTSTYRISLIEQFNQRGIHFKYSKSGEFRALKDTEVDRPAELGFFVDHQARLWNFMMAHIAVPVNADAKEVLQPLLRFFKKMQLNRTYLNEIEPLLATLEKTPGGQFWTSSYFYQMLKALQPEDDQTSFPIPLVAVMIKDITLSAKPIDSVEKDFPLLLLAPLQGILKNSIFDRGQQCLLCELALKEFNWRKSASLLSEIITLLSPDERTICRGWALKIFAGSNHSNELENRIEKTRWLLENNSNNECVNGNWSKTTALWLKALAARHSEDQLFDSIRGSLPEHPQKRALILHIIAWSSLHQGLRDTDAFEYELNEKASMLVTMLIAMSEGDLATLAECYPKEPSPGTEDVLFLLKRFKRDNISFETCVDDFLRNPHKEPRMDYQNLAKTREADLQRMFAGTFVTSGKDKTAIPADKAVRLSLIFADLKQVQAGAIFIYGSNKALENFSQHELALAFKRLSSMAVRDFSNDVIRAQIWALLFEALGRTTRKYPHLAQQFALIANDVCIESNTRVLQLATGEGKSHFVALRAAKQAGMGKVVDVCTAKRTLAERDLEDYQSLYDYLGLTSSYIHPRSSRDSYITSQIHYSTTGDLSLFLDEQSFIGKPIEIPPKNRVALFDEFDFIRFEEGRKTEYNYARPTGRTPKQMTWFYQAVNTFYIDNQRHIIRARGDITVAIIKNLAEALQKIAGDDDERQSLLTSLLRDPLQLVRWLQSAHETHELQMGINFTVREENIQVGDTTYPMREIIPLSSDNQKMAGSTFSAGVQQLLAVRMNTEAKRLSLAQNFHIHPESNIISSQVAAQRMKELWGGWEGFSGTLSASQAQTLHAEDGTTVLHIPTNQLDLRAWHAASFYKHIDARMHALVRQIRLCLDKQQSILFSCKNDAQVQALQGQLKTLLTPDEYANFIFYTNEDELSASEVLSQKRTMEAWHGGKKQQAVGLVASGFGRGDNVGVEAVFLFNVNDVNDLLQKGGRTARNGEEGEVFQFYMMDELEEEQTRFLAILKQTKGVNLHQIEAVFAKLQGSSGEIAFARVMLLREYVFSLQNAANQGYHAGLAQYSSWGMSLIGKFSDPTACLDFSNRVTSSMKNLEKCWLDISSNNKTSPDEKVRDIEFAINQASQSLHGEYREFLNGASTIVEPLKLKAYPEITLEMVPEQSVSITDHSKDLAVICTILARLPVDDTLHIITAELPDQIHELSQYAEALHTFANQLKDCDSRQHFASLLNLALIQIRHSSKLLDIVKTSAIAEVAPQELLNAVAAPLRKTFIEGMELLLPDVSEKIITHLVKKNILSNEARIQAVMPLVTYLGGFTLAEQRKWAGDYLYNLDQLLHKTSVETLSMKLSGMPMSFRHMDSLWKLATGFSVRENVSATWTLLQQAIGNDPEQRLRLFSKWEVLGRGLDGTQAAEFLAHFSEVMGQFAEGKDWDTFLSLVEKTKFWWNNDGKNNNKKNLLELWKNLAANSQNLSGLNDILTANLKIAGKNWFHTLSTYMTLPPEQQRNRQQVFKEVFASLELSGKTAREKRYIFEALVEAFQTRKDPVSSTYVLALIADVFPEKCIGEFLSYRIELPEHLDADVTLYVREKLGQEVLRALRLKEFFTYMTREERNLCLQNLNHIFVSISCANVADIELLVNEALELYTNFLEQLRHTPASYASLAPWYLDFIKQHPEAKQGVNALVLFSKNTSLGMDCLANALSRNSFTTAECLALLRLAKEEQLGDKDFSDSCQYLANINKTLVTIERIGSEAKALFRHDLLQLPSKKMRGLLAVLSEHAEEIKANPDVLPMIAGYAKSEKISKSRLVLLSLVLLKVAGKQQSSYIKLTHIQVGVERFVNARSDGALVRLLDLLERDARNAEELLFDNVASHLEEKVKDGARNQVKDVVDFFYEKAKKFTGQPDLMFNMADRRLAEMFDFTKQRKPLHNQRVIWMHLLNQHAFVAGKAPDKIHDSHAYQWDFERNQKLLQMGLECYITRTREILQDNVVAGVSVARDLNVEQQKALLALADELSIIGKPHLDLTVCNLPKEMAENLVDTRQALDKLMGNYASSWFKADTRKRQFSRLQIKIDRLMTEPDIGPQVTSRYEKVFLAINKARLEAMDNDQLSNVSSSYKMNRGGASRYFNTLNQMQDMVARHWVADLHAVQGFQSYKKHSKDELFGLTDRLFKALVQNDDENFPHPGDVCKAIRKPYSWFITDKTRELQKTLRFDLQAFQENFNSDNITRPDLEALLSRLRDSKSVMPGHLVTIANEILNRGDALAVHLEQEINHEARVIIRDVT